MKRLTHPAILALSPAVLSCFALIGPLINRSHLEMYHNSGPAASIFLATILDTGICWAALAALLLLAPRSRRLEVAVWSWLVLMLPWLFIEQGKIAGEWELTQRSVVAVFLVSSLCWIAVVLSWRKSFLPVFRHVKQVAEIGFAFGAITAMLLVALLFWCFWQAPALNQPEALRHVQKPAILRTALLAKPRIIWLLLDELSYQQVYERRFPGLSLPAFDLVAQQSTVFTHVVPAGVYTREVLPSLMTGVAVDDAMASADGSHLLLRDPNTDQWRPFDPHRTVFQDADDRGYRTAIAGWYNPYCRILPGVLDQCFWTSRSSYIDTMQGMDPEASVLSNAVAPLPGVFAPALDLIHKNPKPPQPDWNRIADYRDLLAASDRFLSDPSIDFLLIHMPFPHPAGIYNRRTGELGVPGTSYIDNLALADRYLMHVYDLLRQRGEWDSTTIVIMGDHSWRTSLIWSSSHSWTAEDQAASHGGQFDDRPAYIVKLPHQKGPAHIDARFPAVKTRKLLQEIMDRNIRSPADLAAFAELESAQ